MSLYEDIEETKKIIYEYESYIILAEELLEDAENRLRFLRSMRDSEPTQLP
jgi:hypothetical protein